MQKQWNIRSKEVRRGIGIDSRVSYLMCNGEAVARPMSSLMLQLLSGSHIPPTGARPDADTHVHTGTVTWTHTYIHTHICYNTIHLIFIVRVGWVFLIRLMVSAAFRYFSCTKRLCWRKLVIFIILFWVIIVIINTLCWTNSFTIYCTLFILIVV